MLFSMGPFFLETHRIIFHVLLLLISLNNKVIYFTFFDNYFTIKQYVTKDYQSKSKITHSLLTEIHHYSSLKPMYIN